MRDEAIEGVSRADITMTRMLTATILVLSLLGLRPASAANWRYCLALSRADQTIFLTAPFPADADPSRAQSRFADELNAARLPYDDIQCPRADDEASATVMRHYAMSFNQRAGNKVVTLPWASR